MTLRLVFVFLCALASVTVAEDTPRCPEGFVQHGSSCYWFSNVKGSFAEARAYCQFFESHLARITSKDEDDFLINRATEVQDSPIASYWLGATDLMSEGTFMWEGGFPLNYKNWAPKQPDNLDKQNNTEHCLMLSKHFGYKWNDLHCMFERKFICEKNVSKCCCKN